MPLKPRDREHPEFDITRKIVYGTAFKLSDISDRIPDTVYKILGVSFVNNYLNRNNPRSKNPVIRFRNNYRDDFHLVKRAMDIEGKSLSEALDVREKIMAQHLQRIYQVYIPTLLMYTGFAIAAKHPSPYLFAVLIPGLRVPIDGYGILIQMQTSKRIYKILEKKEQMQQKREEN